MDHGNRPPRFAHRLLSLMLAGTCATALVTSVGAVEADPLLPKPDPLVPKPVDPKTPPTTTPVVPPTALAPAPVPAPTKKIVLLPVPNEATQNTALEALRETFKDEYSKRKPSDRLALAQTLLEFGKTPSTPANERFAAVREAIDLATKQGEIDLTLEAVAVLAKAFAVSEREETGRALSALTPNLADAATAQTAVFAMLSLIDSCIAADDYALAMRLSKDCETIARKLRDQSIIARAKALGERTKELHDEFAKLGELRDLLGDMTPDGHRRLGQFLCLFKNDWLPGLLHFAAGDDKAWGDLARSDLAAHVSHDKPGSDGSQATAAAEAWRTRASDLPRGTQRESGQLRALTWYRRALPLLAGTAKPKVDKRISELERALGPVAQGSLPLYPPGSALLLTFEAETLSLAGTRLTGVVDASGSGLRFPATGVKPVRGPFGIALEFDGTGQIDVGNPKQMQIAGNQTIAFWMWTAVLDLRRNPYNKSYTAEGTMTLEPSGVVNYFYGPQSTGPYDSVGMNIAVTPKTWIHLAVVRDFTSKTVTWYRNGKAINTVATVYATASISNQPLLIGNGYTGNGFIGQLDDVAVWPRALSAPEVLGLYSATATGR
ncbi:MAG: LamG domain-containing protein [Planctomycetes bacterium]|nr:LamG domain-containing protein [Planctomycetota bacterium]